MTNGIAALCRYLIDDPTLQTMVKGMVFAGEYPPEKVKDGPMRIVVIRGSGGSPNAQLHTITQQPIEIVSLGTSHMEASAVDLAVYQVCKDLDRITIGGVLLHNVQVAGGAQQSRNAGTTWPESRRQAVLVFDEREV